MLAELAMKVRYTIHSEDPKPNKIFNKKQEEREVKKMFNKGVNKDPVKKSLAERIKYANEYFKKKGARNE
jgi:hypothetical protein